MILAVKPETDLPPGWPKAKPCYTWKIHNGATTTQLTGFEDENTAIASGARALFKLACGEGLTNEDAAWRPEKEKQQ